jgi:hypothetical protein
MSYFDIGEVVLQRLFFIADADFHLMGSLLLRSLRKIDRQQQQISGFSACVRG